MVNSKKFGKKRRHKKVLLSIVRAAREDGLYTADIFEKYKDHVQSKGTLPGGRDDDPYSKRHFQTLLRELTEQGKLIRTMESRGRHGRTHLYWSTRYVRKGDLEKLVGDDD